MRVTTNTFPDTLQNQLNQLAVRQNRLQSQAATGQRIKLPSDDPTGVQRVMSMQSETKTLFQYQRNIDRHQETANVTFNAVKAMKGISDRATEIATVVDGLKSQEELRIYAREVAELIKQAAQIGNSKHRGDYLFSGTQSNQKPFDVQANADGYVTGVTYGGNSAVSESEIASGVLITAQMPGANSTGAGVRGLVQDSRAGADFFNHLIELQEKLLAGDAAGITNETHGKLLKDEENFIFHMGANGAIQSRLEATKAIGFQRRESLEKLVSNEADADLAQTLVRLKQTQYAYQAALQSGGAILNQSLLDYIR